MQTHALLIRDFTCHRVLMAPHLHTHTHTSDTHAQSTSDTAAASHANTDVHGVYQEGRCLNLQESQVHKPSEAALGLEVEKLTSWDEEGASDAFK